jgi:hypothetical protein
LQISILGENIVRRIPPPRLARVQLRRNVKPPKAGSPIQKPARNWLSTLGNLATLVTSILVAVIVAGPDNVRNIPKIPTIAYQTYVDAMARRMHDNELTGKWAAKIPAREGVPAFKMILELSTKDGTSTGMMTTLATIPWSRSEFTDFVTTAKGEFLELEFWGFIRGERKTFAKSRIRISPEPCPGICEEQKIDFDNLTLETYWQAAPILPPSLSLRRI